MTTVAALIEELKKMPQDARVQLAVGWSGDTAYSDDGDDVRIQSKDGTVLLEGWMSNCGTELDIVSEEEEDEDA